MQFYIVCVIYNKTIRDIVSYDNFITLKEQHCNVHITVFDNSDTDFKQDDIEECIEYHRNNRNIGLSRCYNAIFQRVNTCDWVLISDDDTYFSIEYLDAVYHEAMNDSAPLLAGVVKTYTTGAMSPFRRGIISRPFTPEPGQRIKNAVCINSGLCIKRGVYDRVGAYDERLFLDMIDHWFFDELKKRGLDEVLIIGGEIRQHFSANEVQSRNNALRRYAIYKKDFNSYCLLEKKSLFYQIAVLGKRRIGIEVRNIRWLLK